MKSLTTLIAFLSSLTLFAHEGHHGPTMKMAPHGGQIFDGKALMGELVVDSSGIKIYFLTHESKEISPEAVTVDKKTIELTDAKKKKVPFEVAADKKALLIHFDKSKSYRYKLLLPVTFNKTQDQLSWQFEPESN